MSTDGAPTVFIAAMEIEAAPILAQLKQRTKNLPKLYEGAIAQKKVAFFISGIGYQAALEAANAAAKKKPARVINFGFAGGLNPSLAQGAFFIPEKIRNDNGEVIACPPLKHSAAPSAGSGTLLTSRRIIRTPEEKSALSSVADAVDMETYAIASVMIKKKIPFLSIRSILDTAREALPLDFSPMIQNGKVSTSRVLAKLLGNPTKLIPLIRLGRRSKANAKPLCHFALQCI